jgi:cobalamin synthase
MRSAQWSRNDQTKLESFVETCINTAIGYLVALLSQLLVFPMVGIDVPFSTNLIIGAWFTVISIIRGYIIRRWFNARLKGAARRIAQGAGH